MQTTYKILIAEDEPDLLRGLAANLEQEGYTVLQASNGGDALKLALKEGPQLILLDVMMPELSGFDVCRELRQKGIDTPIIIVSAKSEEIDRVLGLELGADDYMTKPISLRELLARIRVRLRHRPVKKSPLARYRFDAIELDFEKFRAFKGESSLDLTPKEFDILRLLIRHRGDVVTRDRLLDEVWGYDVYPTTRTVDNHILKLRKKIEEDPANPLYILSIYGEGYKFVG